MATDNQPADQQNQTPDPAQLGGDQAPATRSEDDPRDMSTVMADADMDRSQAPGAAFGTSDPQPGQGSDFDQQRRQGAEGTGNNSDDAVGQGEGMGRAGFNGDEDRGYDQSGHRGGLGSSGGREDLTDRNLGTDSNAFTGGYGGGDYDQPDKSQTQNLGLNNGGPTKETNAG
ncbi:hypothetical protein [Hymenobacter cavernae]|uniref:Uncharacterized protein n=1 Tax=Hymenobacter cavernae TaxID=2044852 RepID=A0ABQ1UWH8_9BACT|nr:hypothetical protein [Hymenobacter cavernae]GGF26987.1 hypothetical protein GCM10011383_43190 [Hymenobacter cavernae]